MEKRPKMLHTQFEFKDIPLKYQTVDNKANDAIIQKIYSKFSFVFHKNEKTQYEQSETDIFEQEIFQSIKASKFIVYYFFMNFGSQSSKDIQFSSKQVIKVFENDNKNIQNLMNCVICFEGKCFIIESISKESVKSILYKTKAFILNVAKSENNDAINFVKKFCQEINLKLQNNIFISSTILPVLSFLIFRYFYPSNVFIDPSFFYYDDFDSHTKNNFENIFQQKITKLIKSFKDEECDHSEFISKYFDFSKQIQEEITKEKKTEKLSYELKQFDKKEFIVLKDLYNSYSASFNLVIHKESLHIFLQKNLFDNVFIHEIDFCKFLSQNPSRFFTRCYGFIQEGSRIKSIIYQYMSNGPLPHYMKTHNDEIFLFTTACSILQGITYMQSYSIVHRDLKPSNILIDHDGNSFISDFETVRFFDSQKGTHNYAINIFSANLVTEIYGTPEQILNNAFNMSTDIYCYGEILYYLFEKKDTFTSKCDIIKKKKRDEIPKMTNNLEYIHKIYQHCVIADCTKRFSIKDVEQNIFSQIDSFYFINQCILNDENEFNVIRYFAEVLTLLVQFNNDGQLRSYFDNQIFSFLFLNSSMEKDISDLFFMLGTFYYQGKNVNIDYSKAQKCLFLSEKSNNINSLLAIGDLYYHGEIFKKDHQKAKKYYTNYMRYYNPKLNNAHLYFDYFFEYINNIDMEYYIFKQYFQFSDEYHNYYSFSFLENLYSKIYGIKDDYFNDKKKTNENKHDEKLTNSSTFLYIGHILSYGKKHDKHFNGSKHIDTFKFDNFYFDKFIQELEQEPDKNLEDKSEIENMIGFLYLHGIIVDENKQKAEEYFRKSASKNNVNAFLNMGNIYTIKMEKVLKLISQKLLNII